MRWEAEDERSARSPAASRDLHLHKGCLDPPAMPGTRISWLFTITRDLKGMHNSQLKPNSILGQGEPQKTQTIL